MSVTTTEEDVDGLRFHLNQSGKRRKEAVLWLHGSGPGATAMSNWERVIGELGDDFYNLAPDIIGFGDSSHPDPAPQGLASYTELRVESLLGLLDKLDIQRCHLVGNSMGGFISLYLALRVPDRMGRMVLMGPGGAPVERTPELTKGSPKNKLDNQGTDLIAFWYERRSGGGGAIRCHLASFERTATKAVGGS